jgi:hypothetical protein
MMPRNRDLCPGVVWAPVCGIEALSRSRSDAPLCLELFSPSTTMLPLQTRLADDELVK